MQKTDRYTTPRSVDVYQASWSPLLAGACYSVLGMSRFSTAAGLPGSQEGGSAVNASRACTGVCVSAGLAPRVLPLPSGSLRLGLAADF